MRKQSGFTLIELMVVMAIIAILATAWLSAYGGYIKKARDSTRISDLRAIESVVLASLWTNWNAPTLTQVRNSLTEMNNSTLLKDPLWDGLATKNICLDSYSVTGIPCKYIYTPCDNFIGYKIEASFESASNITKYEGNDYYTIGKCVLPDAGWGDI